MFFLVTACNDDFLERSPLDQISSSSVFEDESFTNAYLYNLMDRLPFGIHGPRWSTYGYSEYASMIAMITDEARGKSGWLRVRSHITPGAWNATHEQFMGLWVEGYRTIRQANNIIEGLKNSSLPDEFKDKVTASAKYVRAFNYWDLARRYGDVPLITSLQPLDEDLLVSRTPTAQVYSFIYDELVEAANVLPDRSQVPPGSINKQAAIALNARVMLYAQQWEKAAQLADLLITGANNDGIDLFNNYRQLFLSTGGNPETIMERLTNIPNLGHSFGMYNMPVRWRPSGWGGMTNPTQEMVDSYEMLATGLPITDGASGYNPDRPYDGRDMRFYATIFYHGSEFSEVQPRSGLPYMDFEWNNFNEGPGTKQDGAASITGYYVKKFTNPADGYAPQEEKSSSAWQEIRFAEVLLTYAEGANEHAGPSAKVYNAVNRVRARAGLPDLPAGLTKEQMRERIRQERKIELAFENHRWFDLRRWRTARDVLDGYVAHGIKIERKPGAPDKSEAPQLFDPDWLTFTKFPAAGFVQVFPESYYLQPIPQWEIDRNSNLGQNPGY